MIKTKQELHGLLRSHLGVTTATRPIKTSYSSFARAYVMTLKQLHESGTMHLKAEIHIELLNAVQKSTGAKWRWALTVHHLPHTVTRARFCLFTVYIVSAFICSNDRLQEDKDKGLDNLMSLQRFCGTQVKSSYVRTKFCLLFACALISITAFFYSCFWFTYSFVLQCFAAFEVCAIFSARLRASLLISVTLRAFFSLSRLFQSLPILIPLFSSATFFFLSLFFPLNVQEKKICLRYIHSVCLSI